ncbi:MAG: tetratricopeptide repeat protein [Acidobacteriota bacterium]|nr:tetratricopeptide repeat protein [Acidobacteriota bacterium]
MTSAAGTSRPTPAFWRRDAGLFGILILLASLPYAGILANGFVYDDDVQILRNPFVRSLGHLKAIFTTSVFSYQGGAQGTTNYYRPLMTLTYALCHAVFGFRPFGYHLVSIGINAAVVLLVFVAGRQIFKDRLFAFLAAALFALYPVHTEAVDWIAAVTDLELAFFFLLAFWFYLKLPGAQGGRRVLMDAGMIVSAALALLAKEPAATLPILAVIYEHCCREDRSQTTLRVKVRRYGPLWIVLGAWLAIRISVLGLFAPVASRPQMTASAAALSAFALAGHYVEKMVWPVRLSAAYVFPSNLGSLLPRILAGFAIAAACTLLMFYFWKRERRAFFGLAWFFITLAPVLNARWMPDFVFAERYLYLPSVGFCWAICWLALTAARRAGRVSLLSRRAAVAAAVVLAALMTVRIVTRNPVWKDDFTFYTRTLRAAPGAVILRNNLGNYYWNRGNATAAETQWEAAYQLNPNMTYVLDNLGLLRLKQKRFEEAIAFFDRAIAEAPEDEAAHAGLGEAYQAMKMRPEAETELLAAIKLAPLDVGARTSLGELYFDEGKYAEAANEFKAAIRTIPAPRAYFGLGLTEWVRGNREAAENAFKAANRLDPSDSRSYFMLGLLFGSTGRTAAAIAEYEAGLKLDPGNKIAVAALAKLKAGPANK